MNNNKLKIGLFGYGCVGAGLYEILNRKPSFNASIERICVKTKDKKRNISNAHFTYDKYDILNNENIDVVVELIDDANEAFIIVSEALKRGKHVVTANKKMLALHFQELIDLAKQYNVSLLYEGAVAGSIPIIRTLEEYYNNDTLTRLDGILNGTTNYILTKVQTEQKTYDNVLREAQQLGFAESNPTNDVQAFDPKYKLVILLAHAFGLIVSPNQIFNYGIEQLGEYELRFAEQRDYELKLIATADIVKNKVRAFVLPKFIKKTDLFYAVNNEFNAVQVSAAFSDKQLLTGKGAGSFPTAAAVLSDISALRYNYNYEYHKLNKSTDLKIDNEVYLNIYLRYNNNDILQQLQFENVSEDYRSKGFNYIIGTISVQKLIDANLLNNKEVFVAAIDDVIEPNKQPTIHKPENIGVGNHNTIWPA
jgi:homoserine dehydrogenase